MKRILVIEDDRDTLDLLKYIIEDMNFDIHSADKLIPLNEIGSIDPYITLIDYMLPNGRGSDLCLEIKKNKTTQHIIVILMSTHNELATISKDSCADAYLEKPFDIEDLAGMLLQFVK
jgi:two-component system phosphate regulon response regulator PhoB